MTDYGRKLESEYRNGMVVGAIYDFLGKGTHGWMRGYTFVGFDGYGEDLKFNFINRRTNTPYQILASDMGGLSLITSPCEKPLDYMRKQMLSQAKPGDIFNIRYRQQSNGVIKYIELELVDYDQSELQIVTFQLPNHPTGPHLFIHINDILELEKSTVRFVPEPMQLVKKVEMLEWDISKLEVGKAYSLKYEGCKKLDAIYKGVDDTTCERLLEFVAVFDDGSVHSQFIGKKALYEGGIQIHELSYKHN